MNNNIKLYKGIGAVVATILMITSSCTKQDRPTTPTSDNDIKISFLAYNTDEQATSKTVLAGDDYKDIHWMPNEDIAIFYNNSSYRFTSTNTTTSNVAVFEGSIPGISNPSELQGEEVIALYPYNQSATYDKTTGILTTTLPAEQVAKEESFENNLFISMGKTNEDATKINFYNVCSGIYFTVAHDDIKAITLEGNNGEYLAGQFEVKFNDEDPAIPVVDLTSIVNGKKVITVEAPNGEAFIPGIKYYIVTLPVTFSNGLTITGFREDGTCYERATSSSKILKRRIFANASNFDNGVTAEDLYTFILDVTAPNYFDHTGGSDTYSITSYREHKISHKKSPVAWKSQISNDNGSTWYDLTKENRSTYSASWFTLDSYFATPQSEASTIYGVNVNASTSTISADASDVHTVSLKTNSHPSGIDNSSIENAIDLSMYDLTGNSISQTTANCYVVSAPGWYKIPMVYGNAIKNGITNTNSFISSATPADNILSNFIDHTGANITQPWVSNSHSGGAYTISSVNLVWQDSKDLVTNISIGDGATTDADYIYFYVAQSTIHQGNAVIAAYDGAPAAWSWHIWVTDEDFSAPITVQNFEGSQFQLMQRTLGWNTTGMEEGYPAHDGTIQIIQTIGNNKAYCPIYQNGAVYKNRLGDAPYYQYGRKDPFLPGQFPGWNSQVNKTWYDADGVASQTFYIAAFPTGNDCIRIGIRNPLPYNTTDEMDGTYINLWNANTELTTINDEPVVKTVYDPSPIGYTLPPSGTFTGFTKTGNDATSTTSTEDFNVSFTFDDYATYRGWLFNTNVPSTPTIFIPACDYRSNEDGKLMLPRYGNYVTAGANSNCYTLLFYRYSINVRRSDTRNIGRTIICAVEN